MRLYLIHIHAWSILSNSSNSFNCTTRKPVGFIQSCPRSSSGRCADGVWMTYVVWKHVDDIGNDIWTTYTLSLSTLARFHTSRVVRTSSLRFPHVVRKRDFIPNKFPLKEQTAMLKKHFILKKKTRMSSTFLDE